MLRSFYNWLRSFFDSPATDDVPGYDFYRPTQRYIYSYFDGVKVVRADPVELHRRIASKWPELSTDLTVARSPSKAAAQCHARAMATIRELFGVKEFGPDGGLTEVETMELLNHFWLFSDGVKKNSSESATSPGETSPTTPTPTADTSSDSSAGSHPTSKNTDSGSTAGESPTADPTKSPSGPESPSEPSPPA